jgi:catechol 2,3-dioxygenase-like lactoylglutathione lyase family enzyme
MLPMKIFAYRKAFAIFLIFGTMFGASSSAFGTEGKSASLAKPALHHILIEVGDITKSLRFYQDCLGLVLTSQTNDFATLESANSGIYLWEKRWDWEKSPAKNERNGTGIYPHFTVPDIVAAVDRFRTAGYVIIQKPVTYDWGAEAFVQDPDGYIVALVAMTKTSGPAKAENTLFQKCDEFLQKYVCSEGVDYARIKQDNAIAAPIRELTFVDQAAYDSFPEPDKIAYLINVYNLFTIDLIVNHFPLKVGIRDIDKPWSNAFVPLFGTRVSLDYIEHQLLRKKFSEPRIHFALVCASTSCPALSNRAYSGSKLGTQLTEAATKFLTDTAKNRVEGTILELSQLFDWYGADFTKTYGGYQDFVKRTLGLHGNYTVKFIDYDWHLNNSNCRK